MLTLFITKTGMVVISLGACCLMQFCAEVVLVRGMWISPCGECGKNALCHSIIIILFYKG